MVAHSEHFHKNVQKSNGLVIPPKVLFENGFVDYVFSDDFSASGNKGEKNEHVQDKVVRKFDFEENVEDESDVSRKTNGVEETVKNVEDVEETVIEELESETLREELEEVVDSAVDIAHSLDDRSLDYPDQVNGGEGWALENFTCDVCESIFMDALNLDSHQEKFHGKEESKEKCFDGIFERETDIYD